MREITLNVNPDERSRDMIGKLSLWSYSRYNKVRIYATKGFDLQAVYSDTDHDDVYVIGAIWDDKGETYTCHS